jgi:THO complex subunit 1
VTTFEDYLKASVAEEGDAVGETVEVKEEPKVEETDSKPSEVEKINKEKPSTLDFDALYPRFWTLQHYFSDPPKLFIEENFKQFQGSLEATLAKFKEVPKVIQSGDSERKKGNQVRPGENHEDFASTFNPKYLTSRDLFKLEVCQTRVAITMSMTDGA